MRRILVVLCFVAGGCSWILQDHLNAGYSGRSEPDCSTGSGPMAADIILAGLNIIGAATSGISVGSTPSNSDSTSILVGGIIDAVLFTASAATGSHWASECREARDQWERDNSRGPSLTVAERAESRELQRALNREPTQRSVYEGSHPIYCKLSDDPTSGDCFSDRSKCDAAPQRSADCVERTTGACFNADVILDKTRIAICAPSISDCEKKLAAAKVNPDYVVKAEQCGIYRVKAVTPPVAPKPTLPTLVDPEK